MLLQVDYGEFKLVVAVNLIGRLNHVRNADLEVRVGRDRPANKNLVV